MLISKPTSIYIIFEKNKMTRENKCIDDVKKELYITTTLNNISIMINSTTMAMNGMTNADQLTLLVVPVTTVLLFLVQIQ